MVALALVLVVLVLVLAAAVLLGSSASYDLSVLGATVPVTSSGVFLAGAAAMLVLGLALTLLVLGLRRGSARRRKLKALRSAAVAPPGASTPGTPQGGQSTRTGSAPGTPADTAPSAPASSAPTGGSSAAGSAAALDARATPTSPVAGTPPTTSTERQALLAEADEAADDPSRR